MGASGAEIAERRGEHLHGADRGASRRSGRSCRHDRVGADDRHDRRHGPHLRRRSWRPTSLFGIEAQHLLTAVIMTAPGTLMMAKIFVPETEVPETMGTVKLEVEKTDVNVIDAAGARHGRRVCSSR